MKDKAQASARKTGCYCREGIMWGARVFAVLAGVKFSALFV